MKKIPLVEEIKIKEVVDFTGKSTEDILIMLGIANYTINGDVVDVDGDIRMSYGEYEEIPVQFGVVTGNFECDVNRLTSLKGAPKEVGGNFDCMKNDLKSLEHCPEKIGGNFNCSWNDLTSLEFSPKEVGDDFSCKVNKLTSLEFATKIINGSLNCEENQITSLEGSPEKIGDSFNCTRNQLTSLEGCPKEIGGFFSCTNNNLVFPEAFNISYDVEVKDGFYYRRGNTIEETTGKFKAKDFS
jgi:hypothetical protein